MIWLFVLLVSCTSLFAQTDLLTQADSLFHASDYERVELLVLRSESQNTLPDSQRVALELLGGYALIMLDRQDDARRHFEQALEVDSTLTLDPVQVSPKFRVVFDDTKSHWLARQEQAKESGPIQRSFQTVNARSESHIMNLFVPGSGFVNEGKPVRGVAHFVAQAAAAALWLNELSQTKDARKKYLAASTSEQATSLYDDYDSHHRRMWTYGLSTAGIYLLSQFDLALFRKSESLAILPTPDGIKLSLAF